MISFVSAHVFVTISVHDSLVHFVRFVVVVSNATSWLERFASLFVVNLHCLSCAVVAAEVFAHLHPVERKLIGGDRCFRTCFTSQAFVLDTLI
jgi:hypothetical protein